MPPTSLRCFVVGAVLSVLLLGTAPVRAQLVVEPQSLSVSLPQHETAVRTVTLTNTGSETLAFCLSFDRPLQRSAGARRLAEGSAGADEPCGPYGEVLYRLDDEDVDELGWGPSGITMTPEGRLFTHGSGGLHRTFELTPDLQIIRFFEHPHVAELEPFPAMRGIGFDTESGTLWWMNLESRSMNGQIMTYRVLLLEGSFDGEPTGRRIEIVPPNAPIDTFDPGGLAYDVATDLFYFSAILGDRQDPANWRLWAIDRTGVIPEGYPVRPEPYPDGLVGSPDAHGGGEGGPEGVRLEYGVYPPGAQGNDRIVVVDRWGNSEGEALETPVPDVLFEGWGAGIRANPLRSRIDPNGVMYMTFVNFENEGIVGVRPHPLPPSWLVIDSGEGPEAAWDGTLAPSESREVVLTFRAEARPVGEYTSALQAFEAASGEAVEVPLTFTVTEGTDAEGEAEPEEASRLAVYPNPSRGAATVALTLNEASEVRVAVYDVLGREVAVLAEGVLPPGEHALTLDGAGLPSGLYLVRLETGRQAETVKLLHVE